MENFRRFEDDGYKNWIKTQMALQSLKLRLQDFIQNETETYHKILCNQFDGPKCQKRCEFKKNKHNQVSALCERCKRWKDGLEIWANSKGTMVWDNSKPYLWPENKWEVAKVYMARGNHKHTSVEQFDISAFLNLMTNCKHFHLDGKSISQKVLPVTNVRNQVMHTASWSVTKNDLECYLRRIRELGRALEERYPNIRALDDDINQLQNTDFSLILELTKVRPGGHTSAGDNDSKLQEFLHREVQILKDQIESLAKCCEEDREHALTSEELKELRVFLERNKDLGLEAQWERLREVQVTVEQHGQQINTLTNRVDILEHNTSDSEFSTGIKMFKNHLFEEARKRGWPEPKFSEHRESTGYRGIVEINNQTFTGSAVCGNIKTAHQEVAKKALNNLPNQTADLSQQANDPVEEEASSIPSNKLRKLSATGAAYYGSVTVHLTHDICEEGRQQEALESAYKKLTLLLDVQVSSGSSYKNTAVQYCQRRDVPLPQEISQSTSCTLKFSGPITFHDPEGSNKKKLAEQQAAKTALGVLCVFLGKMDVKGENYIGALKELLEAKGQSKPVYEVTDRRGGTGEEERGAAMVECLQPAADPMMHSVQACEGSSSMDWTPVPMDTSEPMEVTHSQPEELNVSGGKFICCVKVGIKKELVPSEASSQEGAVQEAYRSLLRALALKQSPTPGGERQSVLEFFKRSECGPPAEERDVTAERKHRCKLSIMGELSFHSPRGAAKKQQAEQHAAKEALRHLEGLLEGNQTENREPDSCENYKGRLQELIVKHGGAAKDIVYHTTDTHNTTAAGQVTKESRVVCGSNPQAEGSVQHAVATETTPKHLDQPQDEISSEMYTDILTEMRRRLACSGVRGVECEDVSVERRCEWRVCVGFEGFTLQMREPFGSKKEAIRRAYLRLGLAGQICQQDEVKSKEKVVTFFSKNSFPKPKENVQETNTGPSLMFYCSLTDVTCVFTYCGEGCTEAAACMAAVQNALSCLDSLRGDGTPDMGSGEDIHERLRILLEKENLHLAKSVLERTWYKISAKLKFTRCSVELKGQRNKKETKNQLSSSVLRLLGVDSASGSVSARNTMDEWFVRNKLEKPEFEETDGTFGTKLTFTAPVLCITEWQDRYEEAKRKLGEELKKKIQYLKGSDE